MLDLKTSLAFDENENEEPQTRILLCVLSAPGERDDVTQVAN